jgi:hypothetical protein
MHAPKFYSLWAVNGPLNRARLRHQMKELKSAEPVTREFMIRK